MVTSVPYQLKSSRHQPSPEHQPAPESDQTTRHGTPTS
jgi:hypothetical protein